MGRCCSLNFVVKISSPYLMSGPTNILTHLIEFIIAGDYLYILKGQASNFVAEVQKRVTTTVRIEKQVQISIIE